jgi:beta-xylosidase
MHLTVARYFLYGEWHSTGHNEGSSSLVPKLSVYTSTDLNTWRFEGLLHNNTAAGWGPEAERMNFWCPDAVVANGKVIVYFTNQGVSPAAWGVATSVDGVHFDLVTLRGQSSQHPGAVDGNALFIDDDGAGYIAYATVDAGGDRVGDHMVTIDRLAPDYLSSTQRLAAPVFNDTFVEGVMIFKRLQTYYLVFSSCCCCCTAGAGAVVFRSSSIAGPWQRQPSDVNCRADVPICAGMDAPAQLHRPTGDDPLVLDLCDFSDVQHEQTNQGASQQSPPRSDVASCCASVDRVSMLTMAAR